VPNEYCHRSGLTIELSTTEQCNLKGAVTWHVETRTDGQTIPSASILLPAITHTAAAASLFCFLPLHIQQQLVIFLYFRINVFLYFPLNYFLIPTFSSLYIYSQFLFFSFVYLFSLFFFVCLLFSVSFSLNFSSVSLFLLLCSTIVLSFSHTQRSKCPSFYVPINISCFLTLSVYCLILSPFHYFVSSFLYVYLHSFTSVCLCP